MRRTERRGLVLGEGRKARVEGLVHRSSTSKGSEGGFTLIELLVVILIIGIMLTVVVYTGQSMIARARDEKVNAQIQALHKACQDYKTEYRTFPPAAPFVGSQNLHYYLGRERKVVVAHGPDGIVKKMHPLISFTMDWLEPGAKSGDPSPPAFIVDAWQRKIEFLSPGRNNKKGVDIWSLGSDEKDPADDITNWNNE